MLNFCVKVYISLKGYYLILKLSQVFPSFSKAFGALCISLFTLPYSSLSPPFTQQIFVDHLLCAKHCCSYWDYSTKQKKQKSWLSGTYVLLGEIKNKQENSCICLSKMYTLGCDKCNGVKQRRGIGSVGVQWDNFRYGSDICNAMVTWEGNSGPRQQAKGM